MARTPSRPDLEPLARELMRHIESVSDQVFLEQKSTDVGRREAIVLRLLQDGALTMGEISAKLELALSTLTGMIDRLAERKLVSRDRHEGDRRVVVVKLTAKGRKAYEEWQACRVEFGTRLLTELTADERDALIAMFRKISPRNE